MMRKSFYFLCCIVVLLASCQSITPQPARDASGIEEIQQILAQGAKQTQVSSQPVTPPPAVSEALLPPLFGGAPELMRSEESFDLSVDNVAAQDFFRSLVNGSDYNMVIHPEVAGNITLDLKDVTIDQVMEIARDIYGYSYTKSGNLYKVMPAGLRTELFKINYLNVQRRGISETEVSAGRVTDAGDSSNTSSEDDEYSDDNSNNNSDNNRGVVGTRIETNANADFWTELNNTLQVIIGQEEGRRVVITPQAGIIVVKALPEELMAVRDYLQRAELIMRRQVILEAKILEVELSSGFQAGIDWSAITEPSDGKSITFSQNSAPLSPDETINGIFSTVLDLNDFTGIIDLLESQGSVQVLSSPRISTINNQKAVIKVGTDEFFVTEISNTVTTSAGAAVNNPSVELTPFFSGIALDVTPQISGNEEIILHVHPTISEVNDEGKLITVGDSEMDLPLAVSTIRESDSIVYAKSGQVVVIGGLMQSKSIDGNAGAPGLRNVPGVGYMFSQKRQQMVKSELVILLRPVITDERGWQEPINDSMRRYDDMRRVIDPDYDHQKRGE